MEALKVKSEDRADVAVTIFELYKDEPNVQSYFLEHALRSEKLGYNSTGWTKCSEACCKAFLLQSDEGLVLTDRIVLSLALMLAEYHALKEEERKALRDFVPGLMKQ